MTTPPAPRQRWLDYLPAISLAVVLLGGAQAGGGYISQVKENARRAEDNTRRIDQLEKDARDGDKALTAMLSTLDTRTARIEVKLELIAPAKDKTP
ncbi:hypothetical protein [Sphingomonas sp. S2-65]|uniref:hypothetical protein n=1 Tax=Sphingomonas sp. S2-65 TaxID=2903960 RepID=UPI001F44A3DF|nr:hypothetical protein [Sphingomonas sp. S2-65]UYY60096.1 hypothetical protein LZ586_08470 [Sphingomonas sp. S2-65]